jgi:hypothetical protein
VEENRRNIVFGDTILEGVWIILKDGSKEFIKCKEPIVLSKAEENNKNELD